jgi:transposase
MENISISYSELEARFLKLESRLNDVLADNKNLRLANNRLSRKLATLTRKYQELNIELKQTKAENNLLLEQNQVLLARNEELVTKNQALEFKVASLQKQLFGKKKDRINKDKNGVVEQYLRSSKQKPQDEIEKCGRKPRSQDNSPDETRRYDFINAPVCDCCEQYMSYLSSNTSEHVEYEVILKKVKISQEKYVCGQCNKIQVAQGSKLPIPKGLPLAGLLTKVILDKFGNGMPFYRQAQNWQYQKVGYSRQQLNGWFARAADLIQPITSLMYREILRTDYLMCDETELLLLNKEDGKDGKAHMCVMKEGGKAFNFVYCWPIKSRTQEEISNKLKDFRGYLQTDGLNFYYEVQVREGIIKVNCWAHVRRKFVEIAQLAGNESGVGLAFEVVKMIGDLYRIEREGEKLTREKLLRLRNRESKKVLQKIQKYLKKHQTLVLPKSKLGKAINYTLERWEGLTSYLKDSRIKIDNNETERCIKYFVIGRKNWLFADNLDSATKMGELYSLIMSCKINNINPREYLEYIFKQLPYVNKHDIKKLKQLLPDRYDKNRRFDEEYRQERGIREEIIVHDKAEISLAELKVA